MALIKGLIVNRIKFVVDVEAFHQCMVYKQQYLYHMHHVYQLFKYIPAAVISNLTAAGIANGIFNGLLSTKS